MRGSTAPGLEHAWTRSSVRQRLQALRPAASATTSASGTPSYRRTFPCSSRPWPLPDLGVKLGPIELKKPVIAGSGEATANADQIRRALDAGAAAVVAKSANESDA